MQNQEQSFNSQSQISEFNDEEITQQIFYRNFKSYTRNLIADLVEEAITKFIYKQNFIIQTLTYGVLFVISLALLIFYSIQIVKQNKLNLSIDLSCFDKNNVCYIPFSLYKDINYKSRLWIKKDSKDYINFPLNLRLNTLKQLKGDILTDHQAQACGNYKTNAQMNVTYSKNGVLLDPNAIANPCGKIAKLFPYDQYMIYDQNSTIKQISQYKFPSTYTQINYPTGSNEIQWIDTKNSHFSAWISFNFDYILYGTLNQLKAGNYTLKITREKSAFRDQPTYLLLQSYWIFQDFNYYTLIVVILTFLGTLTGQAYVLKRKFEKEKVKKN